LPTLLAVAVAVAASLAGLAVLPALAAADLPPELSWVERPAEGAHLVPGVPVHLAVRAADDEEIAWLAFNLDDKPLYAEEPMTGAATIYSYEWTPTTAEIGANRKLTVTVADRLFDAHRASVKAVVNIDGPATLGPEAGRLTGTDGGFAPIGRKVTCTGDDESSPAATLTYAWTLEGVPVGVSSPTYTSVPADQARRLACAVTATNALGSVTRQGPSVPVAELPRLEKGPKLTGTSKSYALVGDTLFCEAKAAATEPVTNLSYGWLRDGSPLAANHSRYTVTALDAARKLSCVVTAQSSAGGVATATVRVRVGGAPRGGEPKLGGTFVVGSTLVCGPGNWTAVPGVESLAYGWQREGLPIAGATDRTYVATAADVGKRVGCVVTASNPFGSGASTSSTAVVGFAPAELMPPAGPPTTTTTTSPGSTTTPTSPGAMPGTGDTTPAAGATSAVAVVIEEEGGRLKGSRVVVGSVGCGVGPCTIGAPRTTQVKIAGRIYVAAVIVPATVGRGRSARIVLLLSGTTRKALAKVGHSSKLSLEVSVTAPGGSAEQRLATELVAANVR
jgi:hypothetical protein